MTLLKHTAAAPLATYATQPQAHATTTKRRLTCHWLCWSSRRRRSRNCASTQAPTQKDAAAECHQGSKRPFSSTRQPLRWPRAQRNHKHTQQQQNVDSLGTGCVVVAAADGRLTARPRKHPHNKTQPQSVTKAANDPSQTHGSCSAGHVRNATTSTRNNNKT